MRSLTILKYHLEASIFLKLAKDLIEEIDAAFVETAFPKGKLLKLFATDLAQIIYDLKSLQRAIEGFSDLMLVRYDLACRESIYIHFLLLSHSQCLLFFKKKKKNLPMPDSGFKCFVFFRHS